MDTTLSVTDIHYTIVRHASLFDDLAVDQGSEIATRKVVTLPKGSEYWLSTYDLSECIAAILFNPKRYRDKTFSLYGPERLPAKKLPQLLGTACSFPNRLPRHNQRKKEINYSYFVAHSTCRACI
jgi:uncharacterized protein YbjT (DUF2867 family)